MEVLLAMAMAIAIAILKVGKSKRIGLGESNLSQKKAFIFVLHACAFLGIYMNGSMGS